MKTINVNIKDVLSFVPEAQIEALDSAAADGLEKLHNASGEGNDFLGWLDLPTRTPAALLDDIVATSQSLRNDCEVVVEIGIGGSYLGA